MNLYQYKTDHSLIRCIQIQEVESSQQDCIPTQKLDENLDENKDDEKKRMKGKTKTQMGETIKEENIKFVKDVKDRNL